MSRPAALRPLLAPVSGTTGLRGHRRSPKLECPKLLQRPSQLTRGDCVRQSNRNVWSGFRPDMSEGAWQRPSLVRVGCSFNLLLPKRFLREPSAPSFFSGSHAKQPGLHNHASDTAPSGVLIRKASACPQAGAISFGRRPFTDSRKAAGEFDMLGL